MEGPCEWREQRPTNVAGLIPLNVPPERGNEQSASLPNQAQLQANTQQDRKGGRAICFFALLLRSTLQAGRALPLELQPRLNDFKSKHKVMHD
jgi:hypothetical protein